MISSRLCRPVQLPEGVVSGAESGIFKAHWTEMFDFFARLFDTSDFPARWHCGNWSVGEGWLHIIADLATWGAYTAIPVVLLYFARRRRDIPFNRLILLFAAFILACGSVHLVEAIIFWHPIHRVSGLLKLITAVVSWSTVICLIQLAPKILELPGIQSTNEELRREIDRRRLTELRLAESERRFRSTFENAAVGIAHVAIDGRWLMVNDRLCQIVNYSREKLLSTTFQQMTHPEDLGADVKAADRLVRGEISNYSTVKRYLQDSGEVVWVNLTVSMVRKPNGDADYFISMIEDISDRKRVEQQLQTTQERLTQIANHTKDVFWISTLNPRRLEYVSPAFEKIWNCTAQDLYQNPDRWTDAIHPEDRQLVQEAYSLWVADPQNEHFEVEYRVVGAGGQITWISDNGNMVRDAAGQPERAVGVARNITGSRLANARVQRSEADLRTFLDSSPIAMGMFEVNDDYSDILHLLDNSMTERILGAEPGTLAGQWALRDRHEAQENVDFWCHHCREAKLTGHPVSFSFPYVYVPPDRDAPERCWLNITVSHVGWGQSGRLRFCYAAIDDTHRIQAEESLKRFNATFLNLVETAPFGVYVIDADFRMQRVSQGAAKVFLNVDPLIGRDLSEIMRQIWLEPFASEVIDRFRHTLETGESYVSVEMSEHRADIAEVESYEWQLERITMPDGRFGVVCYFYEITQLKRAEYALRLNEQRQSLLLEFLQASRQIQDEQHMLASAAEALGRHLHVDRVGFLEVVDEEHMVFGPCWTSGHLPPLEGSLPVHAIGTRYAAEVRSGRTLGISDVLTDALTEDSQFPRIGTRSLICVPIMRNGYWAAGLYVNHAEVRHWKAEDVQFVRKAADQIWDVVERTRFVRALGLSEGRMRLATELASMGVLQIDYGSNMVTLDETAARLFDLPMDRPVERSVVHARIHPDDAAYLQEQIRAFRSSEREGAMSIEYRVVHADGSVRWLDVRKQIYFAPAADSRSLITHCIIAAIDVTERKDYVARLEHARQQAEAANRARGEFLANMSHEIRTPMTAILGYAELLGSHLKDPDNVQCVETIRRNGRYLLEIINDILDLSKIDAGRMEIDTERIAPADIVSDTVALMAVRAEERHIRLIARSDGRVPRLIDTDSKRLRQILLNLIGNAIKFTDTGSVCLTVRFHADTRKLEFEVADTGIGIRDRDLGKLFQPFTQVDASNTRTFGGTGLGLAISRRLARMLGGDISATSVFGQGSVFSLLIDPGPVDMESFEHPEFVKPSAPTTRHLDLRLKGHFLIVDDRRDIRFLAQNFIEQFGGTVTTASNGQEALDAVQKADDDHQPFAAILMDMQMPVLDGYAATAELRRRGFTLPIIALTANAMDGDAEHCLAIGCDAFLPKPIERAALLTILHRLTVRTPPAT